MKQTQVTVRKTNLLDNERVEVQQMDAEIQIMKEKVAKMRTLNELELELTTLALLRQQYRSHRFRAEEKTRELDREEQKKVKNENKKPNSDDDDSDDSVDSDHSDFR
ncbi:hypothetical protein MBANPS3_004228 [Mucor bainieri]